MPGAAGSYEKRGDFEGWALIGYRKSPVKTSDTSILNPYHIK